MKYTKDNPVVILSFEFSKLIVLFTDELEQLRKYNLANQIFRSGTSIGANVREAQNAESKLDFIHKMKIAAKETDEVIYWLELCKEINSISDCSILIEKATILHKILNKIIGTTKSNLKL
jgi:four helix bundle protein